MTTDLKTGPGMFNFFARHNLVVVFIDTSVSEAQLPSLIQGPLNALKSHSDVTCAQITYPGLEPVIKRLGYSNAKGVLYCKGNRRLYFAHGFDTKFIVDNLNVVRNMSLDGLNPLVPV